MPHLDHIIILVPYAHLSSPPNWITQNFTLTPGGRHAHGETENQLICFKDGSYIELIAFVNDDPKLREGHWWGVKKFGIIDFAFTGREEDAGISFEGVERRLGNVKWEGKGEEVRYESPVKGGRKRPDGVEVKWEVTFPVVEPSSRYLRGELPFFCHDITPRSVRVPGEKKNVEHPSGVYGLKEMNIFVPENKIDVLSKAYAAILDTENRGEGKEGVFAVEQLHKLEGSREAVFRVRSTDDEEKLREVEERGGYLIGDLVFGREGGGKGRERVDLVDGVGGIFIEE